MSAAPVPTPAAEVAALSEGARIINTFIAPTKTFTDLRRNASWWVPWLLIAIVSVAFVYVVDRQVGFDQVSKNEIAKSSRAEQFEKLPPDQKAKQLQFSTNLTRYISYASPVIALIAFVVMAAVLMGTFNLAAGASLAFKTAMAIVILWEPPFGFSRPAGHHCNDGRRHVGFARQGSFQHPQPSCDQSCILHGSYGAQVRLRHDDGA